MSIENILEKIQVNTQSSIRIESPAGIIYLDPLQLEGQAHDADFILITHNHGDHYSPNDIRKIVHPGTVLIVPRKMAVQAAEMKGDVESIEAVVPEEHYHIKGLEFETVPAYNQIKPFHPKKAGWVGYIVTVDGVRIYAAGDTDLTKESQKVRCDIAMIPIGGTFTMEAKKAAELVNSIMPEAAIPIHYGSIVGKAADAKTFASLVNSKIRVEIKL